ncbi:citrate synthase/methylcitrate synthase [Actinobacteria bacterium YIM 96077]|uniref:Citrate synthase n=1 Tax=Phytoactinopolyspora halophila TaxID=1981511 RepID=A0A329R0X4_9ACTN|nr:citrate/2-methylcitrate synthase [Phytoactinopolyspora halophila]AYY11494.1 citrate synthase/methylcitrate synthase [Actinobacteria bacterium YIM 96077]RAW18023.1 citrate synthase/methylcitrate synthase [Phytoactinopolyspora halophila]
MPTTTDELIDVPHGLRNVVAAHTELGDVRGREGFYHYRQYSAIELAQTVSFEDAWYLFAKGRLPEPAERTEFIATIAPLRVLPAELREILPTLAHAGERGAPLTALRAALSFLGSTRDLAPLWDLDPAKREHDALLLSALTPTLLAALYRLRSGQQPLEPRDDLSAAANWLYMVTGEVPDPARERAVERYLIATIDHGFNASTFAARVVASAGADMAAAVNAALGAFSGPLHGGAPDRALDTIEMIGAPENIDPWIRARISAGDRIMGFGHAVYRTEDPRARMLRDTALELGGELADFATTVERRVVEILAEVKPGRELRANVEFYAGVVLEQCRIPRAMFTPTFAVSRVIGWCANILEEAAQGKIIRPAARYVGPEPSVPD